VNTQIPELPRPQIAIDGVFFQIGNSGIARVWRNLLLEWSKSGFAKHLLIIDRDGTAPQLPGLNYYPTPLADLDNPARESMQLQSICDSQQIDLFMSTCYTTPLTTPSLCLVHDLLQEVMQIELNTPFTQEKFYALHHAVRYFAVSQHTAQDLQRFFPQIPTSAITTTLNGVGTDFSPPPAAQIQAVRERYQITQPYWLIVGERYGYLNVGERHYYKNAIHLFQAVARLPRHERYSIVCVGGQPELEPELAAICRDFQLSVRLLSLDDRDLPSVYAGAISLVYPSLYEGFGLPVLEAIACGCPVIASNNSSIPEVAGDAAIYISGRDVAELTGALKQVQQPEIRSRLITAGLDRAQQFSWTKMAAIIAQIAIDTHTEIQTGTLVIPNLSWSKLRHQLAITQSQLTTAKSQIAAMETSKFWKLRRKWLKLTRLIGITPSC
jgi:glycosyltransferase involved in cell wall biosynthesis